MPTRKPKAILAEAAATRKHSINLSVPVSERLRRVSFDHRLSEASVVEFALREWFKVGDDAKLASILRSAGASGRRTITGSD
jgi:hypothetical protein